MNEAKEEWMPEIYYLSASTPYACTWPDVKERRGRKDWARLKRKKTSTGEMMKEKGEREKETPNGR